MDTGMEELARLLAQIGSTNRTIATSRLYALSDLAGERLRLFLDAWEGYPAARRRGLMQALVELAEASFEVNFDAIYRHGLEDPDNEVRAMAVDGLWEDEDPGLIGPLLGLLRGDPAAVVRAAAAAGLGRFVLAGELEELEAPIASRIVTELLRCFHLAGESTEVRRRAVESVSYACSPEVSEALELAYYDDDEKMHASAVFGMGRSCDRRWRAIVLKELESPSTEMRYEAARASGELGLRQAVVALAALIDDADVQVREAAIWSLGQIGGPDAKRILTEAYEDADEEMASALDEALAEQALQEGEVDLALVQVDGENGDGWWAGDEEEAFDGYEEDEGDEERWEDWDERDELDAEGEELDDEMWAEDEGEDEGDDLDDDEWEAGEDERGWKR